MNEEYAESLRKLGQNPENYKIFEEKPLSMWASQFLKWAFDPPRHGSNSWNSRYLHRYVYYYSGKIFR